MGILEKTVSAIVVNYRTAERLPALLAALHSNGVPLETIVVDSASPDMEKARAAGADVFLPLSGNRGFGAAANAGAREAKAPLLLFANPDVKLEPGTIAALVAAIGSSAAVGPRLLDEQGEHQVGDCGEEPTVLRALGYALGAPGLFHRETRGRVGWLTGTFLLVRKDAFLAVSGFDESFFLFGEDVDLGRRLARAGLESRYVPDVRVTHEGAASYRGTELEGTWVLGLKKAHAQSGAGALARFFFALFLGAGLLARGLLSRGEKRGRLLRAARFALREPRPAS
jgi:N-acetylglucosaminyl-diphospho-decaprenol L-rhamnosyltransferase